MQKLFITFISILITGFSFAQVKKDTLKTEEIVVEKPYTPTISDAFKIKINPSLESVTNFSKEKVNYSIFSIPVASTFTPTKGKAQNIARAPKEQIYQNYITAGFGTFKSPLLEAFIHTGDTRYNDYGFFVKHESSEGGVEDSPLNDNFANTRVDLFYKQFDREFNWQVNAGVQRKLYNYYGLPESTVFDTSFIDNLDEKQVYKTIYAGGKVDVEDGIFKGATAEVINFSDNYDSNEIRLLAKPTIEFPISSEIITSEFMVDIVTGKFQQEYNSISNLKHSFVNLGASPNFEVLRENLTINLGAKIYYSNDLERKINKFFAYPNVSASFKIVDDIFILLAGVNGDLIQNTYNSFANENPYISPTLNILQTDKQYNAFVGAKGKLASNIGFNFNVSHSNEKNKPLFIQNQTKTDGTITTTESYQAGNSFHVIYDAIKTLNFFGEITIEASKEFNFSTTVNYANYTTTNELEAWNLSPITATISGDFQKNKWFAGAKLFYRGETKDYVIPYTMPFENGSIVKNDSYLDLNLSGGYNFTDRLTAFAKINNALGKKYYQFNNYQVQSLQALAGITYKFDL
ncbi:TonB-dependent receptor [Lutibacter sp.]|uniref:TonB-dependent receptor n=1 Tax=Lutibacter sp. TaxID=1925666 RepID=UPI001A34B0C1|nr:TonB-dependent receptor [Lutibacter sp.]MBI9040573.1 TonB-dependent receptor [Lutibacter sp.]